MKSLIGRVLKSFTSFARCFMRAANFLLYWQAMSYEKYSMSKSIYS